MLQALFKQIAKANVAIMVETTRHNCSVYQNSYLVAKCMAELFLLVVSVVLKVRLFKHIVVLNV